MNKKIYCSLWRGRGGGAINGKKFPRVPVAGSEGVPTIGKTGDYKKNDIYFQRCFAGGNKFPVLGSIRSLV
jgi:hypothetical protein